jgi:alkane 1-monooxygenase
LYFLLLPILTALFGITFLLGGNWLVVNLILMWIIAIPMDEIVGDNWTRIEAKHPGLWMAILYAQLPTLAIATFLFVYYWSDWTFLGPTVNQARDNSGFIPMLAATFVLGLFYGIAGINVAHELVHRNTRRAQLVGRWLLSFSFDTGFALEHVYGHHINVGTPRDPATPPRGMNFWVFFARVLYLANRNAWRIEKRFLEKRGLSVWSFRNRFITGQLMSLTWVALFAAAGGVLGVLLFIALALFGKLYLEMTNYIEHYGLVRVDGTRVEARHSWNSSRRISNWLLFNLPRHSDHHVRPNRNYWELEARKDAPQLPYGYFVMAVVAVTPVLFMRVMKPEVEAWDRDYATPGERALIAAMAAGDGGTREISNSASNLAMPAARSRSGSGP